MRRLTWIIFSLFLAAASVTAQSPSGDAAKLERDAKPAVDGPPRADPADKAKPDSSTGDKRGDRPSGAVRFAPEQLRKYRTPNGDLVAASNVTYIVDLSAAMGEEQLTDKGERRVRRDMMLETLGTSLRGLTPAVNFQIVSYGVESHFRLEPVAASREARDDAQKWLDSAKTGGSANLTELLKTAVEGGSDALTLAVASAAMRSSSAPAGEDFGDWLVAQVKTWKKERNVRIDVVGFGLDEDAKGFYRKLASSCGGVLTSIGSPAPALAAARPADEEKPDDDKAAKEGTGASPGGSAERQSDPPPAPAGESRGADAPRRDGSR